MRLFEQGSKGMLRSYKANLQEDELFIHSPNIYFGRLIQMKSHDRGNQMS